MPSLWRVAHRDRVTLGRRTNERPRRNPSTPNVRQSLRHGPGILCPHARGHRIGTGKCADWCHHDAWNQKSKIRCNKASGTLPPGQRLLVLVEAAWLTGTFKKVSWNLRRCNPIFCAKSIHSRRRNHGKRLKADFWRCNCNRDHRILSSGFPKRFVNFCSSGETSQIKQSSKRLSLSCSGTEFA